MSNETYLIDTTSSWDGSSYIWSFGEPDTATYGQTFTVPEMSSSLTGFTFYLNDYYNSGDYYDSDVIDFAAYVMAWDGTKATGPVLYSSAMQSTTGSSGFETLTFNTGELILTSGQQYVAFLSASNFFDGVYGTGQMGYIDYNDVYSGGMFVYLNNGSNFDSLTTTSWDIYSSSGDLAFKASFGDGADLYGQQYNFTYYYGNGDYYTGYGYASAGTYYQGQTVDSNWNETGNYGYYTIDSVSSGIGSSYDEVYVTGYYDGDTGYGYASSVSGYGSSGLGSESGTVSGFYSSDDFSNYSEADLYYYIPYDQYNFTYYYGNGDYYTGYGYAVAGTYYSGQTVDSNWNETGNYGYYTIGSVYSGIGSSYDEVYVTSYYDGDTSLSSYPVSGSGYYGLGSEFGTVSGFYSSDDFSPYSEADLYNYYSYDQYNFTYYYGNGDFYSGYGYASAGTYYEGQTIDSSLNETGNYGYYYIDSVYSGGGISDGQVYVTSYTDGDTSSSSYLVSGYGYAGLGSESGTVSGSSSSDSFSNYYEADLLNSSPTLANDLASAILGSGVAIINPSFIGDSRAASLFNDSSLGIGITSGIILSTGDVANIYGPNDSDSTGTSLGTNGDADLNSLVTPSSTLDAAVLEFDFVPTQNFLSFSYVFASEEYNEYVNSSYNDVFGFFLTDSLGNKQNIAIVPGTTTPIAINNINLGSNPAYYRNNDPSDYGFGTTPFNTEFDGLTTVLTAIANVTPGETYRFKLAIADNSDRIYDSAVFITGGTFETTPIVAVNDSVKVNQSQPITINVLGNDLVAGSEIPIIADFQEISDNGGTITLFDNGTSDNLSDDQLIYTPSTGFTGVDEFEYTLADSAGNTHTAGVYVEVSPVSVLVSDFYYFTYNYGDSSQDYYEGYGYVAGGTYHEGQIISLSPNETGNNGYYTIGSVYSGYTDVEDEVTVTSYYDVDTGYGSVYSIFSSDASILGTESGNVYDANGNSFDSQFSNYYEADLSGVGVVQVRLNLLADDGGNPGELIANNQIGVNKSFFVEILVADLRGNAVGVNGLGLDLSWDGFILESINFDPSLDITSQFPLLQDGTLVYDGFIDDLSGGSLPAFDLGQAIGVNQLERFALLHFYTENSSNGTSYFTTTVSSAALADDASYSLDVEEYQPIEILASYSQYNFTYNYGNGDFYTGYVYALEGSYAAGQVLSGYPNETGSDGSYTIDSISSSTFDSWYNNQIYITSYYDGDTGYGYANILNSGTGYYGFGSEYGYAYDSNWSSSDAYFDRYYEADILGNQLYNFTYYYGNGDSYTGYGYAAVDTYSAGQTIDYGYNETGSYGYYVIDSVELGNTNAGYNGYVYLTSYFDGDTGFGTTTNLYNYGNPATYSGLGYEASYAYDADGNSSDSYFSSYSEADILNQYYEFTYTYGNGDSYTGYGYALAGTYAAGQVLGDYWNETDNYGYYTINSVSAGTTNSSYNNLVYVSSYYDGDTGYGLTTTIGEADYPWWDGIYGSSGLGSEQGNAYDTNGNSYDSYFSNSSEADIFANQKFNYTYHYGNGDSYTGYGYAAVDTYTVGQTIDYGYNETGNYGYYTIDSVELGNTSTGYNGYVYITSYTDGDTSYAYGTTTNIGEAWWTVDGIHGYSGLGSEYGYAYTADGYSYDSYFDNFNEADLIVPSISITDNSGDTSDASIKFTTELSKFRKNYSDSDFVRPNYADNSKYFDITNTGTAVLTVSDIQINVAGVTTDLDLTGGDLLLNPNESQRVQLTYTAAAAKEVFNRSDALVLFTDAVNLPEVAIALSGKSTFNSDINYNGIVNTGDLGPLNQARANYNKGILDPTADINGDGMINSLDVSVLLSENKQSVFI